MYRQGRELIKKCTDHIGTFYTDAFLWATQFIDLWTPAVSQHLMICLTESEKMPIEVLDVLTDPQNYSNPKIVSLFSGK